MKVDKCAFYFFSSRYATRFHITRLLKKRGWQEVSQIDNAIFSDNNLILNDSISQHLEYKHLLALLLEKISEILPQTYVIDDQSIEATLAKLTYENYIINNIYQSSIPDLKWILKPSLLNNAEQILLFNDEKELKKHFKSTKRLGGPHVIQRYITNPDLIDGRKYTFRLHVIFTNFAGVFMMKEGYINISAFPFTLTDHLKNKKTHITNYVVDEEFAGIEQRLASSQPHFKRIYEQMIKIVKKTIWALLKQFPTYLCEQKNPAFEIFGYDFILDDVGKLWLLEINQSPDAPTFEENHLIQPFWDPFWQHIVDDFVIPIGLKKPPPDDYQYYHQVFSRMEVEPFRYRLKKWLNFTISR